MWHCNSAQKIIRQLDLDISLNQRMAAGGNGKAQICEAWKKTAPLLSKNHPLCLDYFTDNLREASDYFKSNEMGKLSSSGRAVDWTSKVAQRWGDRFGNGVCCWVVVVKNILWKYGFLNFLVQIFCEYYEVQIFLFSLEDIVIALCDCSWFISLSQVQTPASFCKV